jgi:hypothetical protein
MSELTDPAAESAKKQGASVKAPDYIILTREDLLTDTALSPFDRRARWSNSGKGGIGKGFVVIELTWMGLGFGVPTFIFNTDPEAVEDQEKVHGMFRDVQTKVVYDVDLTDMHETARIATVRKAALRPHMNVDTPPGASGLQVLTAFRLGRPWTDPAFEGAVFNLIVDPDPRAGTEFLATIEEFELLRAKIKETGHAKLLERGETNGHVTGVEFTITFNRCLPDERSPMLGYEAQKKSPASKSFWAKLAAVMQTKKNPNGWLRPVFLPEFPEPLCGDFRSAGYSMLRAWFLGPQEMMKRLPARADFIEEHWGAFDEAAKMAFRELATKGLLNAVPAGAAEKFEARARAIAEGVAVRRRRRRDDF